MQFLHNNKLKLRATDPQLILPIVFVKKLVSVNIFSLIITYCKLFFCISNSVSLNSAVTVC